MNKPDGGPAFPEYAPTRTYADDTDRVGRIEHLPIQGMSLRDYFAGQALITCACSDNSRDEKQAAQYAREIARRAYELADAMIAEREK